MKLVKAAFFVSVLSLTVSCAHKETAQIDEGQKQTKVVKKEEVKKDKTVHAFTCMVGKDARTVTLDRQEKRCEVHYTKAGEKKQVAWGEKTQDICDRAFNNIRSNIEGRGFKCNDGLSFQKKEEAKKPIETASK